MQQPWQSIQVIVVRAQVNVQGVSFHSVCYTADHEYIEKRLGGNINYRVVEEIRVVKGYERVKERRERERWKMWRGRLLDTRSMTVRY